MLTRLRRAGLVGENGAGMEREAAEKRYKAWEADGQGCGPATARRGKSLHPVKTDTQEEAGARSSSGVLPCHADRQIARRGKSSGFSIETARD